MERELPSRDSGFYSDYLEAVEVVSEATSLRVELTLHLATSGS